MKIRPHNMGDVESLLISNDINTSRWYPVSIDSYRKDLSFGCLSTIGNHYRSNIAYNLQYLEFLEVLLKDLRLSSVIITMIYKNYIVVSASIIEILFYFLAKSNNKIRLREYREIYRQDIGRNIISKEHRPMLPPVNSKLTLLGYERLSVSVEDVTKFETLISIVRDNNLLSETDLKSFQDYLKVLRQLRNKIHLTTADSTYETDYFRFDFPDYLRAKFFLFKVITDTNLGGANQVFLPKIFQTTLSQINIFKNERKYSYKWIN